MGGRGASSGKSNKGNSYGSQYHTIIEIDNIKFVAKNNRQSEPLMETMTNGRIYVETGGEDLLRIVFFDKNNKRNKVIERDKRTRKWHVHEGYFHAENSVEKHIPLSDSDKAIVAKAEKVWHNHIKA